MMRSPRASSLPAGASPSPNSAIRPLAKAIQPCSMTRSARTILALPMTVSVCLCFISLSSFSSGRGERCHIDQPVGNQVAYLVVMNDGDHGDTGAVLLRDQF